MNLINPVLDWMVKAGAFIAEGAGLIQFPEAAEPTFQTQKVRAGVFPDSPVGAGDDAAGPPLARKLDAAQAAAQAAGSEAAAALSDAMLSPAEEHKEAAMADAVAAAAAPGPSAGQLSAEVEAWLKTPGAQSLLGGPIQTVVNINSTAVSGQEVVDALGAFVDTNGPLPPHWQQSAQ